MKIINILFILFSFSISAQVLDNQKGNAFTDAPFFNEDFIRKNRIKQLSGYYVLKKKGELMKTTKYKYVYQFDKEGHFVSSYETMPLDGTKDTIWSVYEYNNDQLMVFKKTDQEGFTSVYYKRDEKGRVIEEAHKREVYDTKDVIIQTLNFNTERFEYYDFDRQTKRTKFNSYDLPYLDEFFNYNELGYLVERIERQKMTSDTYTFSYEYNEKGLLSAIRKSSNREDGFLEEFTFKYDELDNLIEKHVYKKGVFITDIQIIYNSKTKLISSIFTRQVSTGYLTIIRFNDFEYF
ncbi:MAG TPA: hypothetical protein EYG86_10085 [Crocinitomicaceae bacterium]|nr:hypothetical protein [Crocinitomicaceae bacterium]